MYVHACNANSMYVCMCLCVRVCVFILNRMCVRVCVMFYPGYFQYYVRLIHVQLIIMLLFGI